MRLNVVLKESDAAFDRAAKKPDCPLEEYPAYYERILKDAEASKLDILDLQGIGRQPVPSKNFQYMGVVEQTVMGFLREHEFPKQVRILCGDQEELTAYMVVYNFWFAEDKASRLNNGKWD